MGAIASQITSLTGLFTQSYNSDADQRKHQRSASLAFVRGIHRGPAKYAENVSIWWRHHANRCIDNLGLYQLYDFIIYRNMMYLLQHTFRIH